MPSTIQIRLINQSDYLGSPQVVMLQKNLIKDQKGGVVAWKVVRNLGKDDYHPFQFPLEIAIGATDSLGAQIGLPMMAQYGMRYAVVQDKTINKIVSDGPGSIENGVELINQLKRGSINAQAYRNGQLLAAHSKTGPRRSAVLSFDQFIWIGVVPGVQEGNVLSPIDLAQVSTKLNLMGFRSADIVMTGGGNDPNVKPFNFELQNME